MPIGISKSSAKDQRVAATDKGKALGVKSRLTESGSFQLGDKATLSTGNIAQTVNAGTGATVTVTDQGAVNKAIELAGSTNQGLLGLLGGQQKESPSIFGTVMGGSAGDTAKDVATAESTSPDWTKWAILAVVAIAAFWFFGRKGKS